MSFFYMAYANPIKCKICKKKPCNHWTEACMDCRKKNKLTMNMRSLVTKKEKKKNRVFDF